MCYKGVPRCIQMYTHIVYSYVYVPMRIHPIMFWMSVLSVCQTWIPTVVLMFAGCGLQACTVTCKM